MYISFDLEATQAEKIALPVHQRFSLVQGLCYLNKPIKKFWPQNKEAR